MAFSNLRKLVLSTIDKDPELWEALWPLTDAYGEPGYMPPQGYDWSGFRDSSDAAIFAMAQHLDLDLRPLRTVVEAERKVPPYAVRKQLREATLAVGRENVCDRCGTTIRSQWFKGRCRNVAACARRAAKRGA